MGLFFVYFLIKNLSSLMIFFLHLVSRIMFAAFEITLTADGTFKNVEPIQNFGSDKDDLILEIIKKSKIYVNPNSNISDGEKFTLFMFYYPQDKNNLSFISQNFL